MIILLGAMATMRMEGASTAAVESAPEQIRLAATLPNNGPQGHPLPLVASWPNGLHPGPGVAGWRPLNQIRLIEAGHFLLPGFAHPPQGVVPSDTNDFFFAYYEAAIKKAAALRLPLAFIGSQWESILSAPPYLALPPEQNPNVVGTNGLVRPMVSPFGPVAPWRDAGRKWTDNPCLKKLQEWYPNPPRVIFLSNNEHSKLTWGQVEEDARYVARYGLGRDAEFKRRLVAEGWIERYRALQAGMRDGLSSGAWKTNALFVGYDAFGLPYLGRWGGWPEYSLCASNRLDPNPLMWDGGSPSYYTHHWNPSTDYTVWSPQVEFQNMVFQQREALALNPEFWIEMSIWDGASEGSMEGGGCKRKYYANQGQTFTPERYAGFAQFGMWLLRPRCLREYRGWVYPFQEGEPYYMALVAAVDRVHRNPVLRAWWQKGALVPNRARQHPYQQAIPEAYKNCDRWFMLDVEGNPKSEYWELFWNIPVFALALTQGEAPLRQWLVYAHSPLQDRKGMMVTIPDYKAVALDVPVRGAFYLIDEAKRQVTPIGD